MSTTVVFDHGRVVTQTADDERNVAEPAVLVHADADGLLLLEQEDRHIGLNRASLAEVIRALRAVAQAVEDDA